MISESLWIAVAVSLFLLALVQESCWATAWRWYLHKPTRFRYLVAQVLGAPVEGTCVVLLLWGVVGLPLILT